MILVDTSIWIEHLRRRDAALVSLLLNVEVLCHPFVLGEISCGNLKNRSSILGLLQALPTATKAEDEEVLAMVERRELMGRGIGWVDAHLVASALLSNCSLWTADRNLKQVATELAIETRG